MTSGKKKKSKIKRKWTGSVWWINKHCQVIRNQREREIHSHLKNQIKRFSTARSIDRKQPTREGVITVRKRKKGPELHSAGKRMYFTGGRPPPPNQKCCGWTIVSVCALVSKTCQWSHRHSRRASHDPLQPLFFFYSLSFSYTVSIDNVVLLTDDGLLGKKKKKKRKDQREVEDAPWIISTSAPFAVNVDNFFFLKQTWDIWWWRSHRSPYYERGYLFLCVCVGPVANARVVGQPLTAP